MSTTTPAGLRRRTNVPAIPATATSPMIPAATKDADKGRSVLDVLSGVDWAIIAVLVVLGAITRFYNIHDPKDIIFDETHFNKFSTWYITRHYYVDIHPPLAKLAFAALLWFRGFQGAREDNVRWWVSEQEGGFIGTRDWMLLYDDKYGAEYLPLRKLSATVGVAFIVITYMTARAIGLRRIASTLAAFMAMTELVILVQSRAILCDIFLYFFNMATIGASFASMRPGLTERQRLWWIMGTGLLLGCAMSVKLTALGTMALVGVHQALSLLTPWPRTLTAWNKTLGRGICRASCLLLPVALVFFGLWEVHLRILKYSGQGDNFMNEKFRALLETPPLNRPPPNGSVDAALNDPMSCPNRLNTWSDCGFAGINEQSCEAKGCCWDPTSPRAWCYHKGVLSRPQMGWFSKMREVLRATWANNNGGAVMVHPFMSEWYEWPVMKCHSVPFASTSSGGQLKAQGNPAVWWGVFGTFLLCSLYMVGWVVVKAYRACAGGGGGKGASKARAVKPRLPPQAGGDDAAPPAVAADAAAAGAEFVPPQGWVIPFVVLWTGYLLNLVPYIGITRSKFVYHYIPALMVGVLLASLALQFLWARAQAPAGTRSAAWRFLAPAVTLAAFGLISAAFYYWCLPYGYGVRLSWEQHAARKWVSKW